MHKLVRDPAGKTEKKKRKLPELVQTPAGTKLFELAVESIWRKIQDGKLPQPSQHQAGKKASRAGNKNPGGNKSARAGKKSGL